VLGADGHAKRSALRDPLQAYRRVDKKKAKKAPSWPTIVLSSDAFFKGFVDEWQLPASSCTLEDIEVVFDFVQSVEEQEEDDDDCMSPTTEFRRSKQLESTHPTGALTRAEWLQVLVRIAAKRYGKRTGTSSVSVSVALEQLCRELLMLKLPSELLSNANHFRKLHCYVRPTAECLRRHLPACRKLYAKYSVWVPPNGASVRDRRRRASTGDEESFRADESFRSSGSGAGSFRSEAGSLYSDSASFSRSFRAVNERGERRLMTMGGWLAFVEATGFVEARQLTMPQAKAIFLRSRIRTCHSSDALACGLTEDRTKICPLCVTLRCHLELADWFEALVRLATTIALPTDEELHAAGASDADAYLRGLRFSLSPSAYDHFLQAHARHWEDTHMPRQPAAACLHHLMHLLSVREEKQ